MKRETIVAILAWALLLFLLHVGITKLRNFSATSFEVSLTPLFHPYAKFWARLIPVVELSIAVLLFFKPIRLAGFISFFCLAVLYIIFMYTLTPQMPHFRGGMLIAQPFNVHLITNITVAVIAGLSILLQLKSPKIEPASNYKIVYT